MPAKLTLSIAAVIVSGAVGCGDASGPGFLSLGLGQPVEVEGTCGDRCDEFRLPALAPTQLRVLSYNVFLRPAPIDLRDESDCRAPRIGQWLAEQDFDIVALQETFQPTHVASLTARAQARLPHQLVSLPAARGALATSGGLTLLSRFPIEDARTLTYDACRGTYSDCMAAKGAVHAVIRVSENSRVNVVMTHLDAGRSLANREARSRQIEQLERFVAEIDDNVGPTILLGDFNINALADDGEYDELLEHLGVVHYDPPSTPSTVNCSTNILCEASPPPARLDYVFSSTEERRLVHEEVFHLPLADESCGDARYLSDHRAVAARFLTDL